MQPITQRDEKLELKNFSDINVFTDYCNELSAKRPKSIGYKAVDFMTDSACLVVNSGDWHLGNKFCRYDDWLNDLKLIKNTKNVFAILTGDYCDNYHRNSVGAGIYEQVIPISEAKEMCLEGMQLISDRILGIYQGCHDNWIFRLTAEDQAKYFASKSSLAFWMGFFGSITINIGDIKYKILTSHRFRRYSSANLNHGLKFLYREVEEYDIAFGAHRHTPNLEISCIKGVLVYTVRCSSYKIMDRFSQRLNYNPSLPLTPCVLLEKDTKNVMLFKTIEEGIRMLEIINKNEG